MRPLDLDEAADWPKARTIDLPNLTPESFRAGVPTKRGSYKKRTAAV